MPQDQIDPIAISWTNPRNIPLAEGKILLYLIRVIDAAGTEYSYIGQTKQGAKGLQEYVKDVKKIFLGKPRKAIAGKGKYRAVHLALAKACEHGWPVEFYPLENVGAALLEKIEQKRMAELRCNLNAGRNWQVEDYGSLSVADLL
ncbi:MAG: hypothetical protein Q8Q81_12385 [Oxalobacteraceae bacterium]|nr:hypothetical protein [Oxalobacteraceae bacterium]